MLRKENNYSKQTNKQTMITSLTAKDNDNMSCSCVLFQSRAARMAEEVLSVSGEIANKERQR